MQTEQPLLIGLRNRSGSRRRGYLRDGTLVTLRPLHPSDRSRALSFFAELSARTRYYRFMRPVRDLDEEIVRVLFDQSRQAGSGVLVAVCGYGDASEIVGGGRYVRTQRRSTCEFAMTVIDSWQGRGLGTMLLHALQQDARAHGHHRMIGYVLSENAGMLSIAARARMRVQRLPEDPSVCLVSRTLFWVPRPAPPAP